jgi:hypothetical protein
VRPRAVMSIVLASIALAACGSSGGGTAKDTTTSPKASVEIVSVTGTLDAKTLDEGVCAWVETPDGRVEVWVGQEYGQVFSFLEGGRFEGVRSLEAGAEQPGDVVFAPGDRVTVTGSTYTSTPECGEYGVNATEPMTAA